MQDVDQWGWDFERWGCSPRKDVLWLMRLPFGSISSKFTWWISIHHIYACFVGPYLQNSWICFVHGKQKFNAKKITISRVIPQNRVHFDVIQCLCMVFRSLFVDCWWFHSMFAFESLTQKQAEFRGTCFKWFLRGGSRTSSLGSSGFTIITLLLHGENQRPIHWQVLWIKWKRGKPRNPWKFSKLSCWKNACFFFEPILAMFFFARRRWSKKAKMWPS